MIGTVQAGMVGGSLRLGPELLANYSFESDLSGWTNSSTGTGTATWSNGSALLIGTDGSNRGAITLQYIVNTNKTYLLEIDAVKNSGDVFVGTGVGSGSFVILSSTRILRNVIKFSSTSIVVYTSFQSGNYNINSFSLREIL